MNGYGGYLGDLPAQSWQNLVRGVALGFGRQVSDEEVDFILWERTAFPVAGLDTTRRQVVEWFTDPDAVERAIDAGNQPFVNRAGSGLYQAKETQ